MSITLTIEGKDGTDVRKQLSDLLATPVPEAKSPPTKPPPRTPEVKSPPTKPPPRAAAEEPAEEVETSAEKAPIAGDLVGEPALDIDALKKRFEQLTIDDYDTAEKLIDSLEVDNFAQAVAAGKEQEIADFLAALA